MGFSWFSGPSNRYFLNSKFFEMDVQSYLNDSRNSDKGASRKESKAQYELESCENMYWFPDFLNEVCPFKGQYGFEWKRYLIWKNSEAVGKSVNNKERFSFYTPNLVKSVFNVCKMFRQPPEVRYLAIDILDRFLVAHFLKVKQTYQEMGDESPDTWDMIVERLLKQSPLRILSSVELAMKYSWSCNIVTAADIQEMLKFLGHKEHYPKKSILKSEARVYQHLNFNIPNRTPLTYLEMFFDDFQRHKFLNLRIPLHNFFTTCIYVLDVATVFHRKIYKCVADIKQKIPGDEMDTNFSIVSFKANFLVLAASVIFASSILEDPTTATSTILTKTLCCNGECTKSDIEALGKELLIIILDI